MDEKRNPRTKATVNQLLDKYLSVLNVEAATRDSYDSIARNHIRPLLGDIALGRIDGETLDSFYGQLRTCRAHCRDRKYIEHHTDDEHTCDDRCQPHARRPLATARYARSAPCSPEPASGPCAGPGSASTRST